jgi:hypothetical protein
MEREQCVNATEYCLALAGGDNGLSGGSHTADKIDWRSRRLDINIDQLLKALDISPFRSARVVLRRLVMSDDRMTYSTISRTTIALFPLSSLHFLSSLKVLSVVITLMVWLDEPLRNPDMVSGDLSWEVSNTDMLADGLRAREGSRVAASVGRRDRGMTMSSPGPPYMLIELDCDRPRSFMSLR